MKKLLNFLSLSIVLTMVVASSVVYSQTTYEAICDVPPKDTLSLSKDFRKAILEMSQETVRLSKTAYIIKQEQKINIEKTDSAIIILKQLVAKKERQQ